MKLKPWKYKFNPLQFVVLLIIFNFVYLWFHEFGHALTGILGDGVIEEIGFGYGIFWVAFSTDPTGFWGFIMPFAGGLFGAGAAGIMMWASNLDDDVRLANYFIYSQQILYGLTEGILHHLNMFHLIHPIGLAAMILATIFAIYTAKDMWNYEPTNP